MQASRGHRELGNREAVRGVCDIRGIRGAVNPGWPKQNLTGKQLIFLKCYNTGRKSATWTLAQIRKKGNSKTAQILLFDCLGCGLGGGHCSAEDWLSHRASFCADSGWKGMYSLLLLGFFCFVFKTGVTYVAQAGLELLTLLVQPPDCWDYRCVPTCLDFCYAI